MHLVHTSRLPALRRFWLTGLAAAMLVGPTLAVTAQAAAHGQDHKGASQKHDKAAGHAAKGSDHAGSTQKHDKATGHSKKGSGGANILGVLEKAAKAQSDSQKDQ